MSSSGELHGVPYLPDDFSVFVMLPNGSVICMNIAREDTLEDVKKELWKIINTSDYQYFGFGDQTSFIFTSVTRDGKYEEFFQESRRVCDLRLFDMILKVVEPPPEEGGIDKRLCSLIDLAIGEKINELILELPRDMRDEVSDFRNQFSDFDEITDSQIDQQLVWSSYSQNVDVPFKLKVVSANYVNVRNVESIFVRVAVYHGTKCLEVQETTRVEPSNPKWDQWINFNLHFTDLPRHSKLSMSICVSSKKRPKETCSLGSMNMSLFDYMGVMRSGRTQVTMWPPPKDSEELLFPLGNLGNNPTNESPCLLLELMTFDKDVVFAPIRDIHTYATHVIEQEPDELKDISISSKETEFLKEKIKTPPFEPISPEEKKEIWDKRFYCKFLPDSLPKLLDVIDWGNRDHMSQLYLLLKDWKPMSLEIALRLLDIQYEDEYVRAHALKSLDNQVNDELLSSYLLQLVQVLKTEPYLENELSNFLIRRAVENPVIGNRLFWYLRSECDEISDYHNTIRFRYLMERYLRRIGESKLNVIVKQVQGVEKLLNLAEALQYKNKDDRLPFMKAQLQRVDFKETLQNIPDPLNINRFLGEMLYDECRIMDSAKRPLWLVWSLPEFDDERADTYTANPKLTPSDDDVEDEPPKPLQTSAIIFKTGDDLRQDMLTLQIIRIVDKLWDEGGLHLSLLTYTCLATSKNVGIIEVVNRAETITSIQRSGGRMASIQIDSSQLHRWIKERNQDQYDEAIDRFTRSCAGYSVLTFVLGIADRNPDNIMVGEDGRIFHIDFGHFLGHFKKKFGINRERVPFVLTDDFLHVIARGSDNRKTGNFDAFRELCGQAYIHLRRHSDLLITLFTMMLRTGIPELRSADDISYLRTNLQVGATEDKAREFFQAQFFEAFRGAWATKVDWFFHNIKRM